VRGEVLRRERPEPPPHGRGRPHDHLRDGERAVDDLARDCGRSLLVLDTETGSDAERLYALPAAEALGRSYETLVDASDRRAAREAFLDAVAGAARRS